MLRKKHILMLIALAVLSLGAILHAGVYQTINLGTDLLDDLGTSAGNNLNGSFEVSLGTFDGAFTPTDVNVADWSVNWRTFDETNVTTSPLPPPLGGPNFQLSADLMDTGYTGSSSPAADTSYDFSGKDIWLWVRNKETIDFGTEWFLARVDASFATPNPGDCCPGEDPLNLSLLDLISPPVFGSSLGVKGGGIFTFDDTSGTFELQTFKVIPEPGTLILSAIVFGLFGIVYVKRERRGS